MRVLPGWSCAWAVVLVAGAVGLPPGLQANDALPPIGYEALLHLDQLPLLADWPAYQDSSTVHREVAKAVRITR